MGRKELQIILCRLLLVSYILDYSHLQFYLQSKTQILQFLALRENVIKPVFFTVRLLEFKQSNFLESHTEKYRLFDQSFISKCKIIMNGITLVFIVR